MIPNESKLISSGLTIISASLICQKPFLYDAEDATITSFKELFFKLKTLMPSAFSCNGNIFEKYIYLSWYVKNKSLVGLKYSEFLRILFENSSALEKFDIECKNIKTITTVVDTTTNGRKISILEYPRE